MFKRYDRFYDKMLKHVALNNLTSFFLFFGLYCLPYFPIRNEIIDNDLNSSFLDFPVLTSKGIVNLEFQFIRTELDNRRFLRYGLQLYEKYGLNVFSVVIDFKEKEDFPLVMNLGGRDKLTIYVKSLFARKADKVLNRIKYKIENNIRLTGVDIVGLLLLPLLDLERKEELLDEAIEILFLLNEDLLSLKKIKEIRDCLMYYSKHWNYDKKLSELGRWSSMKDEFCKDTMIYYGEITREEGRAEGLEKGLEEGRAEGLEIRSFDVARDMIKDGFSAEAVSKYSRLDLAVVNGLMLMK